MTSEENSAGILKSTSRQARHALFSSYLQKKSSSGTAPKGNGRAQSITRQAEAAIVPALQTGLTCDRPTQADDASQTSTFVKNVVSLRAAQPSTAPESAYWMADLDKA